MRPATEASMRTTVRCAAVVLILALYAACSHSPTSPGQSIPPQVEPRPAPPTPPTPTNFPPLEGPSRTFVFDHELSYGVADYTKKSRFVIYDDGAFNLEYPSVNGAGYRGAYKEENGVIAFEWEDSSAAAQWSATGTLNGNSLTVQYGVIMQLDDFEDAVYVLQQSETR